MAAATGGTRQRKKVQRLVTQDVRPTKEFSVPEGTGVAVGDIPIGKLCGPWSWCVCM